MSVFVQATSQGSNALVSESKMPMVRSMDVSSTFVLNSNKDMVRVLNTREPGLTLAMLTLWTIRNVVAASIETRKAVRLTRQCSLSREKRCVLQRGCEIE